MPIIAISGPHGSGKSTAARKLADRIGYKYVSAGKLFREMANKNNLSLEEYSKKAETYEEIDRLIDNRTLELAEKFDNLIIDAQLSGWLLRDKACLLVYITAPFEVRVNRISNRDGKNLEKIRQETMLREKSEKMRYKSLYNIDIIDTSIYDIIVNTARFSAEDCAEILFCASKTIIR